METLRLTKKDFKDIKDSYYKEYCGKQDISDFDGNIEIESNLGYVRFNSIKAKGYIVAEAGSGIKAGEGIEAGWGIKAGEGIEAGSGIKAGLSISCKLSLNIFARIFTGLAIWKRSSDLTDEEKTITCGKLENGEVCFGILKEIGLPEDKKEEEVNLSGKEVEVKIDGKTYNAVIK
jgi:hypothetical protein